eukprot:Opistho-1_new@36781
MSGAIEDPYLDDHDDGEDNVVVATGTGADYEGHPSDDDVEDEEQGVDYTLDPDHPLMRRVQERLKRQLQKERDRVVQEHREKSEQLKKLRQKREETGVELYSQQQQLAKLQMLLEKANDNYNTINHIRKGSETKVGLFNEESDKEKQKLAAQRKNVEALQAELDRLNALIQQADKYNDESKAEVAVTKRVSSKAKEDMTQLEQQKVKQDLLIDEMSERAKTLSEKKTLYEAQLATQAKETKAILDTLAEATAEIEAISYEKKQIFQQWRSSLVGMQRRDDALRAIHAALSKEKERLVEQAAELQGYRGSIRQEQGRNENLTVLLNRVENEITTLNRQLEAIASKREETMGQYSLLAKALQDAESELAGVSKEHGALLRHIDSLNKDAEQVAREIMQVELEIMNQLGSKASAEKLSDRTQKSAAKMRAAVNEEESRIQELQNDLSKMRVEAQNVMARNKSLKAELQRCISELKEKNVLVGNYELEIRQKNQEIEKKQKAVDRLNKQLDVLSSKAADENSGLAEVAIAKLQREIDATASENTQLQQFWLRDQHELVTLAKDAEDHAKAAHELSTRQVILERKRLRLEQEIAQQHTEMAEYDRNIRGLQADLVRLNRVIQKNANTRDALTENMADIESEFASKLKEAELDAIRLEEGAEGIREERQRMEASLIEAERQIMLWEQKLQLAKETRAAIDPNVGAQEIQLMRSEIHRMTLRYEQLQRQQEKMIQEMEKSIERRESISTRGRTVVNSKAVTQAALGKKLSDVDRKLKTVAKDLRSCDREIAALTEAQNATGSRVEEVGRKCKALLSQCDMLEGKFARDNEIKQKNLEAILFYNRQAKRYKDALEGRYAMSGDDAKIASESARQEGRMQSLNAVLDSVIHEHPHLQRQLGEISATLNQRLASS